MLGTSSARNTNSVIWQRNLATSYIKIGDVLAAQEHSREALEQYQKRLGNRDGAGGEGSHKHRVVGSGQIVESKDPEAPELGVEALAGVNCRV